MCPISRKLFAEPGGIPARKRAVPACETTLRVSRKVWPVAYRTRGPPKGSGGGGLRAPRGNCAWKARPKCSTQYGKPGFTASPQKWKSASPGWPIGQRQTLSDKSSRLVLSAISGLGLAGTSRRGGAGGSEPVDLPVPAAGSRLARPKRS